MICLAVTYVVKQGEEEQALAYLTQLAAASREEPGNLMYLAHRSPTNPRQFFLYEQYADQDAFDFHRRQPHFIRHAIDGLYTIIESRIVEVYAPLEQVADVSLSIPRERSKSHGTGTRPYPGAAYPHRLQGQRPR